mmetsp:Transcript_22645/g.70559  ORF Transcript_22645/g.70559 Transcript_22645/m.70559 type:complete len:158 (-) Transcript_22645:45-518(-)
MQLIKALLLAALAAVVAQSKEVPEADGSGDLEELDGDDDDLSVPQDAEDEGDEEGEENEQETDNHHDLNDHLHGPKCMEHAEMLEREVGLFDNHEAPADTLKNLAERMDQHAASALGKSKEDYKEAFHAKLSEVREQGITFGAADVCRFMLQHHDEL